MLKRLIHIVMFLLAGTSISQATHILGGEITYEHLTNNQYRFYVKIYRDCGECLLGGRGGGDVVKDCGGFKVNLRSSGLLDCSATELASFTPTFISYEQVLPICEDTRTLCHYFYFPIVDPRAARSLLAANFSIIAIPTIALSRGEYAAVVT